MKKIIINDALSLADAIGLITHIWKEKKYVVFSIHPQQRSLPQNSSLHLYCEMLADELNDKGLDMRKVLKPEVDIPWSGKSIKKYIWKKIQKIMFDTDSTADLTRPQVSQVFDVINRNMINVHNVDVKFPSKDNKND